MLLWRALILLARGFNEAFSLWPEGETTAQRGGRAAGREGVRSVDLVWRA